MRLIPHENELILIESALADAESESLNRLRSAIERIPPPPIEEGPVAFAIYRRVNLSAEGQIGVRPFGPYQKSLNEHGADVALMKAVGLRPESSVNEQPKQSLVQRVRAFFTGSMATPTEEGGQTGKDSNEWSEFWIGQWEHHFAGTSTEELERLVAPNLVTWPATWLWRRVRRGG